MSKSLKILFFCIIGLLSGLAVWPVIEWILLKQVWFQSYLILDMVIGAAAGCIMGIFFGGSEGLILNNRKKMLTGLATGAVTGTIGGVIGFLAAQKLLLALGNYFIHSVVEYQQVAIPASRIVSWLILGIFIAISEGIRALSLKKVIIGILGGLCGGLAGGFIMEMINKNFSSIMFSRLTGLCLFGFMISFFYSLIENRLAFGSLRLLNGKFKGKEFVLNQRKIRLGAHKNNDISIPDYTEIAKRHAELRYKGGKVILKALSEKPVRINDENIDEYNIQKNDVIQLGNAKFLYQN
ncbi:MAG: FHA domain-containing protein [Spirochaetes bacterium]|nr:FHA domain-containing protein [Spirochaetota bacterium]